MSHDILDRLLAALRRNPHLEFQVWMMMQDVHFYGPWVKRVDLWVVADTHGKPVASIESDGDYKWKLGIPFTALTRGINEGTAQSLPEAQQHVESALGSLGWRRAPDELWPDFEGMSQGSGEPVPSVVGPWVEEMNGDWSRYDRRTKAIVAYVEPVNGFWAGKLRDYNGELEQKYPTTVGGYPNKAIDARCAIDHILYRDGRILWNEMEVDPDIPF